MSKKNNFYELLIIELLANVGNQYVDNYDEDRFGVKKEARNTWRSSLKKYLKKRLKIQEVQLDSSWYLWVFESLSPYLEKIVHFYDILSDEESKELLVRLVAYRILGESKYKLPLSTPDYWKGIEAIDKLKVEDDFIETRYVENQTTKLYKFDLNKINIPIHIYYQAAAVFSHINVKQYEYKTKARCIKPEEGDIVLDCGACWGDTALFFSNEVGSKGHIYSFEFIPTNIKIFEKNLDVNPSLKDNITLVPNPLSGNSGDELYYIDNGPGSRVSSEQISNSKITTINIDDFFIKYAPKEVNFIKMDIEGSELPALKGGVNVIQKFKPKLAISIYHSMDDFVDIVQFIESLNLGYEFYLKHGTIHLEETVLLAITTND